MDINKKILLLEVKILSLYQAIDDIVKGLTGQHIVSLGEWEKECEEALEKILEERTKQSE